MFYGKTANELQENVVIGESEITGTLHYITDYTDFSGDPEKNKGNYLALTIGSEPTDAKITVEFKGGQTTPDPIVLEPDDRNLVFRITDKDEQSIKITAEKDGRTDVNTYGLSGLILEEE